jgi:DNA-binding NarL/FixJ family response regulator
MKTIVVIDKHPVVRAGLEIFIKNNFGEVTTIEFDSFSEYNKATQQYATDVFIVGNTVELPSSQCKLIAKLKEKNQQVKVIIYDDNPDYLKVSQYFKSGATGYVTKRSDMNELLACISDIRKGQNYISSDVLEVLIPKWASTVENISARNETALTHREFEVATYLLRGDTVHEIAKKSQRDVSTIRAIKKNLLVKLKITNLVDLRDVLQKTIGKQTI